MPCVKTEDAHCGWAWGTQYAGKEQAMGIDEMGYLSAEGLLEEVRQKSVSGSDTSPVILYYVFAGLQEI